MGDAPEKGWPFIRRVTTYADEKECERIVECFEDEESLDIGPEHAFCDERHEPACNEQPADFPIVVWVIHHPLRNGKRGCLPLCAYSSAIEEHLEGTFRPISEGRVNATLGGDDPFLSQSPRRTTGIATTAVHGGMVMSLAVQDMDCAIVSFDVHKKRHVCNPQDEKPAKHLIDKGNSRITHFDGGRQPTPVEEPLEEGVWHDGTARSALPSPTKVLSR
ncbi:predicted protein [Uncinocarpus reesii 1704]|uniref:Uncharacterized protein n=1 Tax=Uncinocarpus reesii (strain UAMH 1704) TaxID=336963 RepID=C4JUC6_UNCRE|nr:uncharacterized protein UREG_06065 [Uncinocarpus reesii 1704]EEP81223.1 predicted protein [Uncinocarpus reesii 1704]